MEEMDGTAAPFTEAQVVNGLELWNFYVKHFLNTGL